MSQGSPCGWPLRRRALWSLAAQALVVALPGLALAAAGLQSVPGRGWLLGTTLWALPRAAGAIALWSTRRQSVRETWLTRLLFRLGAVVCWVPAPTATALLVGWVLFALQDDSSALMAAAELDSTLSALCLGVGVLAFGLGFRLGRTNS